MGSGVVSEWGLVGKGLGWREGGGRIGWGGGVHTDL